MSTAVTRGSPSAVANRGLKGVVAADSEICRVDGQAGRLIYRGYDIHDLTDHSSFEEVCYLLLHGNLPKEAIQKNCHVDFYSASLQHYMGIPEELFTCVFAASRIAGWCAHVLEQWQANKIIRPSCNYVGPAERPYVTIDQR